MPEKRMRIFAGPNGSGKSSLFQNLQNSGKFNAPYFLNADLLEKQIRELGLINLSDLNIAPDESSFNNYLESSTIGKTALKEGLKINLQLVDNFLVNRSRQTNSYEASLAASFIRKALIESQQSFAFETVMSHRSKLEEVQFANNAGYRTYLYFVSTESPLINLDRIQTRVAKGGHPVEKDKVLSRFTNSLSLLLDAILLVRRAYIFDNSGKENRLIAEFYNGVLKNTNTKDLPFWFHKNVLQKISF